MAIFRSAKDLEILRHRKGLQNKTNVLVSRVEANSKILSIIFNIV